jgi:hypothetical protein
VSGSGSTARLNQVEVERYGHCNFEAAEVLGAFSNVIGRLAQPLALRQ